MNPQPSNLPTIQSDEPLQCRLNPAELSTDHRELSTPPDWIMYMPAGTHTIHARHAGTKQGVERTVDVRPEDAATLQAALTEQLQANAPQRPYFDFEHEEKDASAWPREFQWRPDGIWCRVEWSRKGADAVVGKSHRAFSPAFLATRTEPARVAGILFCAGSLTNEPAFKKILPLWAKNAETNPTGSHLPQEGDPMSDANAAVLTAEIESLKAKCAGLEESSKTVKEENKTLRAKCVQDALDRAVNRGAIEPKNEKLLAKYKALGDVELIDALPGKVIEALAARESKPVIEVGAPGIGESLKGFRAARELCDLRKDAIQAKKSAKDAGAIYAREIRTVIEQGGFLPLQATDTLVTDIVSQRVFDYLRLEFPLLNLISTNFSDEQLRIGQNVITRLITPPDVVSYHTTTGWPNSTTTAADISVPMTAQKAVQIRFQSNQLSGTNRRLFDEQAMPAAYSLKKEVMDAVLALVTTAFTPTGVTKALADFDRKTVIEIRNKMKKAAIPTFNMFALLSTDYYDKLAEDESIVSVAVQGSGDAIRTGKLPPIHGLQIIEAQNESWANNIEGIGAVPSALALATGVPTDYTTVFPGVNAGGAVRIVTDAETGLSMMEVKFIDHQLADAYMRLALMYGAARGPVTHGVLLKSA